MNTRYRAYIKESGKMIPPNEISYVLNDGSISLSDKAVFLVSEIFLMKSIKQDESGEELFEGDIIKSDNYKGLAKIIWCEETYNFCAELLTDKDKEVDDTAGELSSWAEKGSHIELGHFEPFKVVGNIHQNSELLKEGRA